MKKHLVFSGILVLVFIFPLFAKQVEIKDARPVGKNFYFERISQHKSIPYADIAISSEFAIPEGSDPVYYIFNINEGGFIIVAADDAVYPVLGYSFERPYSPGNPSPEFTFWMNNYKEQIVYTRQNNLPPDLSITTAWNRYSADAFDYKNIERGILEVQPLISTTWHQIFPYNTLCPEDTACGGVLAGHVWVGCVATAMGQIMHYWRYPQQGQGFHCIDPTPPQYGPQCADFGNTIYDWNGMVNAPGNENIPVALLSFHAGVSVDMIYAPMGSTANQEDVPIALRTYFRYSSMADLFCRGYDYWAWVNLVKNDLILGRPIQYGGDDLNLQVGHAWVCDGYQGDDYFHMNWGWGGYCDGYYYLMNLNPSIYLFNWNQCAIMQIEPDPSIYPSYCSGQTNLVVNTAGSIEDGSGPVKDYQDNANCSWLIAPDDSISLIRLTFVKFNLAPGDSVNIYDGPETSSTLLGTYTGTTNPPDIFSTGPQMLVTFTSDGSETAPGFLAEYYAVPVPFCSDTTILTDATGNLSDGSGQFNYRNASTCVWKIAPPYTSSTTLNFSSFDTEQDKDKVQIYDLANGSLIASYSGSYTTPPAPVTCQESGMMVVFKSDSMVRKPGWDASYISVTNGNQEVSALNDLYIYPNPATDRIEIETLAMGQLSIHSLSGQPLITRQVTEARTLVDITTLPSGVYVLKIVGEKGVQVGKFVKQ